MKIGDILKINENYDNEYVVGIKVLVIVYDDSKIFPVKAKILSGEYSGEIWRFLEDELS